MRQYAPQLEKAYELASSLFYPEILEEEKELASSYDNEKSNSAVILYNEELNKILKLPYFMRFKMEYAKAVRGRIWSEVYPRVLGYRNFLFVTFDASTTKYHSQKDAHEKIQRQWNSLLTRIRKKYKWVSVIKTVEWQDNGLGCHLHVLFCGLRFIPKKWIKKTWDKLETSGWAIQFDKIRKFEDPKRAVGYILKYISKSLRKDDYVPLSLVINWALHLRSFSVSCRFSPVKTNSNFLGKGWVFLGVMPWDLAINSTDIEILGYFGYG